MAISNRDRVGQSMDLLKEGLFPFFARVAEDKYGKNWWTAMQAASPGARLASPEEMDVQAMLTRMRNGWNEVFAGILGINERNLVHELIEVRNRWAHQAAFTTDDAERALDSVVRLLRAVSAGEQADAVERERQAVRRAQFEEYAKREERKAAKSVTAAETPGGLRPWREVITPHLDVRRGNFQQAEFAADLNQVALGEGVPEYRDPIEFFRRTYLTEGLRTLLLGSLLRLAGIGGDPVIELQTNFGGGKTHSMLALFHLSHDIEFNDLPGFEPVLKAFHDAGGSAIPLPKRAVLVGTALGPGEIRRKDDGTETRTLWGELAWQLGRRKGYALVAESDRTGLNPGSERLAELFRQSGPSLILIDEWVAFVRQLSDKEHVAGTFEANLSFAQSLTEAVRQSPQSLLVASLPQSNIEVGGQAGVEALNRLRNTFGRMQTSWRPATTEESFEIVRRRLFEPIESGRFPARDATTRAFADLYRTNAAQFPRRIAHEGDYKRRLDAAFPIHPELFDQLYGVWSTLDKFQRTRGVLRLMASVIHALWQRNDASPLIMPGSVPMDDDRVRDELTRYLEENWKPVVEKDVDGVNAQPLVLDAEHAGSFGRVQAARRVARTIYLGSAPALHAANRGIEDTEIRLGCAVPGESVALFGDALRTLSQRATHLYEESGRYWFSTQPSLTRTAQDRAAGITDDHIEHEVETRLKQQKGLGDFARVHLCPGSSADVRDEPSIGLVVLRPSAHHLRGAADSPAKREARAILDHRGEASRNFRNALVFAAVDQSKWKDLAEAVRLFLAWSSIADGIEKLDLTESQRAQVKSRIADAERMVAIRLDDAYQWVLFPRQPDPKTHEVAWDEAKTLGDGELAKRVSARLRNDGLLNVQWNGPSLRKALDAMPVLWRDQDYVPLRQLADDFARYLYLEKLKNVDTLLGAVGDGLDKNGLWVDVFAVADAYDAETGRFLGLTAKRSSAPTLDGLLVKAEAAQRQFEADRAEAERRAKAASGNGNAPDPGPNPPQPGPSGAGKTPGGVTVIPPAPPAERTVTRFYATVELDPKKLTNEVGKVGQEVLQHLAAIYGANVTVTLDISASVPSGIPDDVRRVVDENSRTLRFKQHGFEEK
jgi:hypothetical protein